MEAFMAIVAVTSIVAALLCYSIAHKAVAKLERQSRAMDAIGKQVAECAAEYNVLNDDLDSICDALGCDRSAGAAREKVRALKATIAGMRSRDDPTQFSSGLRGEDYQ